MFFEESLHLQQVTNLTCELKKTYLRTQNILLTFWAPVACTY